MVYFSEREKVGIFASFASFASKYSNIVLYYNQLYKNHSDAIMTQKTFLVTQWDGMAL